MFQRRDAVVRGALSTGSAGPAPVAAHGPETPVCYVVRGVRARFTGDVDPRRQQAEGAFEGAEGAQDGGDLGRNGQLEAGSKAELAFNIYACRWP